jgi:hypothetical protein
LEEKNVDKLLLKVFETALQPVIVLLTSIDAKLGGGTSVLNPVAPPAAGEATAPAKAAVVTEVPAAAIPVVTREELGKALVGIAKVDMQKAKDILSQFKAAQLADVAAADYPKLDAAIKAQAAEFAKADAAKDLLG